eukprot:TRINITY_DN868_c0_g1_i1.p1 TRINITY_DN868_c0_g1~~TRINITY_DN868_c0_g1_i1.p1  ORF type:complete len:1610 (+),score=462.44 TRINITY_DN868_c0_g1_i1:383-4831(+)
MDKSSEVQFRFHINSSCSALDIRIETLYGTPSLYVDTEGPASFDSKWLVTGFQRPLPLVVCPSDPLFKLGTYFIKVRAVGVDTSFSITARSVPILPPNPSIDKFVCENPDNSHTCVLQDGLAIEGYSELTGQKHYYVYNVTECQQLSVMLQPREGADADLWWGFENNEPYYQTSDGGSERVGDDEVVFTVCPKDSWNLLYFTVDLWSLSPEGHINYTLHFNKRHNSKSLRMRSMADFGYYWSPQELGSVASFRYSSSDVLNCFDWSYDCKVFWSVFPSNQTIPFYPPPPLLYRTDFFSGIVVSEDQWSPPPPSPNAYVFAVLLNTTFNGVATTLVTEEQLTTSTVILHNKFSDSKGNPVTGTFTGSRVHPQCDYTQFQESKKSIEALNKQSRGLNVYNQIRSNEMATYLYTFDNSWYGCRELLNGFVTASASIVYVNTTLCSSGRYTESYNEDPCCSTMGSWFSACVQKVVPIVQKGLKLNENALSNSKCSNRDCVSSLMQDYQFIAGSSCETFDSGNEDSTYESYRKCKDSIYSTDSLYCTTDSDCSGRNSTCDLYRKTCRIDRKKQDQTFLNCLISSMDQLQKISLASGLGLDSRFSASSLSSSFFNKTLSLQCFDSNSPQVSTEQKRNSLEIVDRNCATLGGCKPIECEDKSCTWEEDSCLAWCRVADWRNTSVSSNCSRQDCNWNRNACLSLNQTDCQDLCVDSQTNSSFCGWSEDGLFYKQVAEYMNETECVGSVCATLDVTQDDGLGYSTGDCASNSGGCTIPCNLNFQSPSSNISSLAKCNTADECTSSGFCSINSLLMGGDEEGGCVLDRVIPDTLGQYDGFLDYPFCFLGEISVPKGCLSRDYNLSQCNNDVTERGGVWLTPKKDKVSCEEPKGCYERVHQVTSAPPNYVFTSKSQRDCALGGGQWLSLYKWTSGVWVAGSNRNLSWNPRSLVTPLTSASSLDFLKAQSLYFDSFQSERATRIQSASLCSSSRSQNYLNVVSCDCGSSSSSNCFTSAPISTPVAEGIFCPQSNTLISSGDSFLMTGNQSISSGCSNLLLSTVSGLQFLGDSSGGVAGHFIDVQKSTNFGLRNSHDAVVGVLVGDGLEITSDEAIGGTVHICIALRDLGGSTELYSIYDFASSNEDLSKLIPQNIPIFFNQTRDSLCADVKLNRLNQNYFPIKRLDHWETITVFENAKTEYILSYFLAALYGLTSFGAFAAFLVAIFYLLRNVKRKFLLTDAVLFFIFSFAIIRTIYFSTFGRTPVQDFVLSALPTFIYFTAFSLIISFWAVTAQKYLSTNPKALIRYGSIGVILTNVVLYLILMALGIAFSLLNNKSVPCGRRSTLAVQQQKNSLEQLSLAYAIIISVFSLIFALGFAYFGIKLAKRMTKGGGGTKRIILYIAAVFSISYALHSIFIIVVARLASRPSSIFSFIGLFITEIAPCMFFIVFATRTLSIKKNIGGTSSATRETGSPNIQMQRMSSKIEVDDLDKE